MIFFQEQTNCHAGQKICTGGIKPKARDRIPKELKAQHDSVKAKRWL